VGFSCRTTSMTCARLKIRQPFSTMARSLLVMRASCRTACSSWLGAWFWWCFCWHPKEGSCSSSKALVTFQRTLVLQGADQKLALRVA
jgi:hypothetical protein